MMIPSLNDSLIQYPSTAQLLDSRIPNYVVMVYMMAVAMAEMQWGRWSEIFQNPPWITSAQVGLSGMLSFLLFGSTWFQATGGIG